MQDESEQPTRFVRDEHPATQGVLEWTFERDVADARQLLEWLTHASTVKDRRALLDHVRGLLVELNAVVDALARGD
ncbi:MAG TPA: hypothetical protein QF646_03235 [Candidatus Poseidoniales archaeon]|nr:hypothetical protein [Candidatus Poseidoniales archaeon]